MNHTLHLKTLMLFLLFVCLLAPLQPALAATNSCLAPPSNLVSWFKLEDNGNDQLNSNKAGYPKQQTVAENAMATVSCPDGYTISGYQSIYGVDSRTESCGSCTTDPQSCSVTYSNTNCGGTDPASGVAKMGVLSLQCGAYGPSGTSGKIGRALTFNGSSDYLAQAKNYATTTNNFTMEFWANPTGTITVPTPGTSGTTGNSGQRYAIFPTFGSTDSSIAGAGVSVGTNGIAVFEHTSSNLYAPLVYNGAISGWTHIAVVYTNKVATLYINGTLAATGSGTTSRTSIYPSANLGEDGHGYGYYQGDLDEVHIFSRSLSDTEITSIYNAGSAGLCDPPVVTGLSVSLGPVTGGTSVQIFGTALTNASAVKFGTVAATSFTVDSDSQISATTPAVPAGTVDVTVTTLGGTSASGAADKFTFLATVAVPTVTTSAATAITGSSAIFNGVVNANDSGFIVSFEYGTTIAYGSNVAASPSQVSGNSSTPLTAAISALTPFTTYHFRVKAVSAVTGAVYYGDDATFVTPPRLVNLNDGTMLDTVNNLRWLQNANCFGTKNWDDAITSATGLASGSCSLTDRSIAGDWHLPTLDELSTLVAAPDNLRYDTLNTAGFTQVQASGYWSSSTHPDYTGYAWRVGMGNGSVNYNLKDYYYDVWPVRGGQYWMLGYLVVAGGLDFGTLPVNSVSSGHQVTLKNTGAVALSITGIALNGANADQFGVATGGSSACSSLTPTLTAGASCTVLVTATPTSTGSKSATLTVTTDAGSTSMPLTATAISRFVDLNDGTMLDTAKNLRWLKNVSCFARNDWGNAMSSATGLASGSCSLTDHSVAGDWHLPTLDELKTLIAAPDNYLAGSLNTAGFTTVQEDYYYWSSSTDTYNTGNAWFVYMKNGYVNSYSKGYANYVWPVRSGQYWPLGYLVVAGGLDFGSLPVNSVSSGHQVTLKNTGTAALSVTGIALNGADAGQFGVATGGSSACSSLSPTLAAGASCTLLVTAQPTTGGSKSATLTVTTGAGSTSMPLTATATYLVPAVSAISPASGPAAGGTTVTITGTNLNGASAVKFGTVAATGFSVNSNTQITASAPAGSPATVDVTVTTPGGTSATGSGDQFSYTTVDQTISFGTAPTIAVGGNGIVSATATSGLAVTFSSLKTTVCTINGATVTGVAQGDCTIAADQAGDGTYNPAGQQTQSFTILAAAIPTLSTTAASNITNTSATLNGSVKANYSGFSVSFEYGTTIAYGSSVAASPSQVSGNSSTPVTAAISALTPLTTYHFRVKAVNAVTGTVYYSNDATFTTDVPRFVNLNDGTVLDTVNKLRWLRNANCTESAGGVAKTDGALVWGDASTWSNNLASGLCGLNDKSAAGDWHLPTLDELKTLVAAPDNYRYDALATAGFVNVQADYYWSSSTYVYNSDDAWYVNMYDGLVDYVSKDGYGYVWPARAGQYWSVGPLVIAGGLDFGTLPVGSVSPGHQVTLKNTGAAALSVAGSALNGADASQFGVATGGSSACPSLTPTLAAGASCTLLVTAKPTTGGSKSATLTVTTAAGSTAVPLTATATYSVPTVTGISPTSGFATGGTSVTITGTALTGVTGVKFGATAATGFSFISDTKITATSPAGAVDQTVYVTVTTPGGTSATGSGGQFTYTKLDQTISFGTAPTIAVGGNGIVSATATSGLAVTFSSQKTSVCTISGATVTGVAQGICTIAADQAGDGTYNPAGQQTQSFTILAAATPTLSTTAASNITNNSTTLNGSVKANYSGFSVSFEYGTTIAYGSSVAASPSQVSGNSSTPVTAAISALTPVTTYHFRVKAVSAVTGTVYYSNDATFTTATTPTITIGTAASSNGSWSGASPDVWIPGVSGDSTVAVSEITARLASTGVTITAGSGAITVASAISWTTSNTLMLNAGTNIVINANISAKDGDGTLKLLYGQSSTDGSGYGYSLDSGAQVSLSSGNHFSTTQGSSGTETAWYVITSLGSESSTTGIDLQGINGNLSGHYVLGKDIDAKDTATWNSNSGFTPIGTFAGSFNGLGHTISKLTINRGSTSYVGLFGYSKGSISNVWLTDATIYGQYFVGGLAGGNQGSISTSYVTASVTGTRSVGGLAGWNDVGGSISNSSASASVTGPSFVGGLVGQNDGSISASYATGSASASASLSVSYVGGLVGQNNGSISASYATASVTGPSFVGGLVGQNDSGSISASYFDTTTTGIGATAGCGNSSSCSGVTGLTDAQMMTASSFSAWETDISSSGGSKAVWRIYETKTYPLLRSFLTPLTVTANDATKVYDGTAYSGGNGVLYAPADYIATRVAGGLTYAGTSQGATAVGSYTITPGGLYSDQLGYDISFSNGTLYIINGPPTVTTISPASGFATGGTSVTITGSNLTNASGVTFGATAATGFTFDSDTKITATSPAGVVGQIVDVRVTTPGGTSATSSADHFTYTLQYQAKNQSTGKSYATLAEAISAAAAGHEIRAYGAQFDGAVSLVRDILLNGGYDLAFSAKGSLPTTLNGNLTVTGGAAKLDSVTVKGVVTIGNGSLQANGVTVQ